MTYAHDVSEDYCWVHDQVLSLFRIVGIPQVPYQVQLLLGVQVAVMPAKATVSCLLVGIFI
jgi:hypothetical protein